MNRVMMMDFMTDIMGIVNSNKYERCADDDRDDCDDDEDW